MFLDYKSYFHYDKIEDILNLTRSELAKYLSIHEPTDMADLVWFETNQYRKRIPDQVRDIMEKWYALPLVRKGELTEWHDAVPALSNAALSLPGIINFSINAISPYSEVPTHSDYSYDMREDLTDDALAYVILLAIDIPSKDITECGFHVNNEQILLETNDIIAFDGAQPHGAWNHTDKWRYTVNIDLSQEYWNV